MGTPVEQIKERLSIVDVVGSYVTLQKAGKSYKARSPFTNEKTPSFFVSPERGMYYCFSSGRGGDMFTFIEEMEGVDFKGALKILAERAGVELVPEDPQTRSERETLYAILESATQFFETKRKRTPAITEYLKGRGLTDESIELWRIGFAPDEWRSLKEYLLERKFSEDLIVRSGLIKKSEEGGSYDVFRNRVMFPISDASGRVVAFSGRRMNDDPASPKYVNSPETELFVKSEVLFGYHRAKSSIRTYDFSLVVEGQFDLVLSHQVGYTNAVAISGTALSPQHVALLGRLSNRVVLALDSDSAGIASVKRSASLMLARGMDIKVARMMGGKDPADLAKEDPALLKKAVGGAVHVVEFLIAVLRDGAKDERSFRLQVRDEVIPFLSAIQNRIDREYFEGIVAKAIETTPDAVRFEVERFENEKDREQRAPGQLEKSTEKSAEKPGEKPASKLREEDLIGHLFGIRAWLKSAGNESWGVDITKLSADLGGILGDEKLASFEEWSPEAKSAALFTAEQAYIDAKPRELQATIERLLLELFTRRHRGRLAVAKTELFAAERSGDQVAIERTLAVCNEIQKALAEVETRNPFTYTESGP